jgi:hypothetical protein
MDILHGLREEMRLVEEGAAHDGYWYSISDILIILVCGMLCGLRLIDDVHDWAKAAPVRFFLEEQFKITKTPCRAQYYNILRCVDASKFGFGFNRWMSAVLGRSIQGKTVAVDGKTVCGTGKLTQDGSVLHIASALVSELNLVIGSLECGTKTGEQTAFRELIGLLDVSGAIVVADALHCSRKSAQAVVESGADYLFVVKDNCSKLHEDIKLQVHGGGLPSHQAVEKNGGRLEADGWPKLTTIGAVRREFENIKSGEKSDEWHYYISSAALCPKALLTHARLEWSSGVTALAFRCAFC